MKVGPTGAPGKGVKYHVRVLFFCDFLHIFGSMATVFALNNVFRWGLISQLSQLPDQNFSPPKPPKYEFLNPFLSGQFSAKNVL